MKQVKELSLVQSVFANAGSMKDLTQGNYAIGFASTDFIIWNLVNDTKVVFWYLTFFFFEMISLFIMMLKSLIIKHDRFYKFHVVDGGALILIFLVFLQKFRAALHI